MVVNILLCSIFIVLVALLFVLLTTCIWLQKVFKVLVMVLSTLDNMWKKVNAQYQ